jgi:hypothetical protein
MRNPTNESLPGIPDSTTVCDQHCAAAQIVNYLSVHANLGDSAVQTVIDAVDTCAPEKVADLKIKGVPQEVYACGALRKLLGIGDDHKIVF